MKLNILFLIIFIAFLSTNCKDKNADKPVSVNLEEEKEIPTKTGSESSEETIEKPAKKSKTSTTTKDLTIGLHKVKAKNGLMLRTEPKRDSPAVVRMEKNMQAEILEYTNIEDEFEGNRARWAKVKYKKYTGYAFTYYLEPMSGAKKVDPSKAVPSEDEEE